MYIETKQENPRKYQRLRFFLQRGSKKGSETTNENKKEITDRVIAMLTNTRWRDGGRRRHENVVLLGR